jgi:hypothetical protein
MASGHQVRESALPSGRTAAAVPPPARRAASGQAVTSPAAFPAGTGQRSPVTADRRRASSAVAVPASAAATAGRPDSAAAHAPTVHQDA